ncbi:hypothetical protein AAFF_G00246110 [Aldrovandia affinis]|uniref:Uncharacterized protein n=1 Tax=Aldrovandia affinis TaxID=143900 RepID=A0AAD7WTS6_9TELE|nr:hypothetical protein AAFF_G00246110 [Aldrovandia affinis]
MDFFPFSHLSNCSIYMPMVVVLYMLVSILAQDRPTSSAYPVSRMSLRSVLRVDMWSRKRYGETTPPWGTPDVTSDQGLYVPFAMTLYLLPVV